MRRNMAQKFASQKEQGIAVPTAPEQGFFKDGKPKKSEDTPKNSVSLSVSGVKAYDEKMGRNNILVGDKANFSFDFNVGSGKKSVYLYCQPVAPDGSVDKKTHPMPIRKWLNKEPKNLPEGFIDKKPPGTYEYYLRTTDGKKAAETPKILVTFLGEGMIPESRGGSPSTSSVTSSTLRKGKNSALGNDISGEISSTIFYDKAKRDSGPKGGASYNAFEFSQIGQIAVKIKTPGNNYLQNYGPFLKQIHTLSEGMLSSEKTNFLPKDFHYTANIFMAGVKFELEPIMGRSSSTGIVEIALGYGMGKPVGYLHVDAPFPLTEKVALRLYGTFTLPNDYSYRPIGDPYGTGVAGSAVEFWPSKNLLLKGYVGATGLGFSAEKSIADASLNVGFNVGYSTPNKKFSMYLDASTSFIVLAPGANASSTMASFGFSYKFPDKK